MNIVNSVQTEPNGVQQESTARSTSPPPPFDLKRPSAAVLMLKSPAGMDRAKKILKALGTQEKYVKDHQQQSPTPLVTATIVSTPSGHSSAKRPAVITAKKKLTPTEKAQETVDEIEELKKTDDTVRPIVFFTEHMIHHITADPADKRSVSKTHATRRPDETPPHAENPKKPSRIASLEAIKAYNNMEAEDKASDEDTQRVRSLGTPSAARTTDAKNNSEKRRRSDKHSHSSKSTHKTDTFTARNYDDAHKRSRRRSRDERNDDKHRRRQNSPSRSSKSASKSTPSTSKS